MISVRGESSAAQCYLFPLVVIVSNCSRACSYQLVTFQLRCCMQTDDKFRSLLLQGAIVLRHEVSFAKRMAQTKDKWLVENVISSLMASFARLDVPVIMEEVRGFQSHQHMLMFLPLGVHPLPSCLPQVSLNIC